MRSWRGVDVFRIAALARFAVLVGVAGLGACQKYGGVSPEDPDEPPARDEPARASLADAPPGDADPALDPAV